MHRSKRFLAVAVVASLFGSSFAWAVALLVVPPGAYEVVLEIDGDRLAILLNRIALADRHQPGHDASANGADGLHDEHVVTLATLEACSTSDQRAAAKACGPAVVIAAAVHASRHPAPLPSAGSSRAGPPLPGSFTVLRI